MNAPTNLAYTHERLEAEVRVLEPTQHQMAAWRALSAVAAAEQAHGIPWDTRALAASLQHAIVLLEESRLHEVAYLNRRARIAFMGPALAISWRAAADATTARSQLQLAATVLDEMLAVMQITTMPTRAQRAMRRGAELAARDLREIALRTAHNTRVRPGAFDERDAG